jgi:cell division protein FtsB
MINRLRNSRGWQIALVTSVVLFAILVSDVSGRMSILRRMHQEKARLSQELALARTEHESLRADLRSVQSDRYLDEWARVEARLTRPGEVAIIPVMADQIQLPQFGLEPTPDEEENPVSNPDQWRRLFFEVPKDP